MRIATQLTIFSKCSKSSRGANSLLVRSLGTGVYASHCLHARSRIYWSATFCLHRPPQSPSTRPIAQTQRRYSHTLVSARTNGDDQGVSAVVTEINSQLTSSSAWVGVKNLPTQTITIDAGRVVSAIGLLVQKPPARMPFYVQTFSIFTWTNSGDGRRGTNRTGGTLFFGPQSYTGANEIVFAWFEKPVSARYFQINPITWHKLPAMRVGLALESGLTSAKCDAMLRDPTHLFRRMWAAEAWGRMLPGKPSCFYVVRRRGEGGHATDNDFLHPYPLRFMRDAL